MPYLFEDSKAIELLIESVRLQHVMQAGVELDKDTKDCSPKHLRVGVNSGLVNVSALAELLLSKGLITEIEYAQALVDGMRAEIDRYEKLLSRQYGVDVKLGV